MDTGGKIRTGNILKQLSKQHDITLISNLESPKDDEWLPEIPKFCSTFVPIKWKEIKKGSFLFFLRLFFQMFSIYPVSVLNDYSAKLRKAVEKELEKGDYDIAICDFVQSALLFKNVKKIPTLLFQHNVESVISQRHITQNTNPIPKLFWWLQWRKMFYFEKKACNKFDTTIAVSDNDRNLFNELYKADSIKTIPTGVDIDYYTPLDSKINKHSLIFCGSMDWLPNEDAVLFFINEILSEIKSKVHDVHLIVVGRNPSSNLMKIVEKVAEVTLTGWVDDTRPYIEKGALFIVPIRIGGGTRMKIYEAMAMGKTVVSTTIGAEGLPLENNKHIMIEDDPIKFGKTIINLFLDTTKSEKIGANARKYVVDNFAWSSVAKVFSDICDETRNRVLS